MPKPGKSECQIRHTFHGLTYSVLTITPSMCVINFHFITEESKAQKGLLTWLGHVVRDSQSYNLNPEPTRWTWQQTYVTCLAQGLTHWTWLWMSAFVTVTGKGTGEFHWLKNLHSSLFPNINGFLWLFVRIGVTLKSVSWLALGKLQFLQPVVQIIKCIRCLQNLQTVNLQIIFQQLHQPSQYMSLI